MSGSSRSQLVTLLNDIMQAFLIIILASIFSGAIITYFLARRRPKYAQPAAILVLSIVLLLWLIVNRSLPLMLTFPSKVSSGSFLIWNLRLEHANWHLSLYLLLLSEALLLIGLPGFESAEATNNWSFAKRLRLPVILSLLGVTLLALWSDSFVGLVSSWTLVTLFWIVLLWSASDEGLDLRQLFWRAGVLLLGVLFLWLAAVSSPDARELPLSAVEWPTLSLVWAILAAFTFIGAIPIFWWRPFGEPITTPISVLVHIIPTVVGASLLARLVLLENGEASISFLVTLLGLVSLFLGSALAWRNMENAGLALPYLVLAQAGLITIVGAWAGSEVVIAQTGVLTLALGGLFLATMIQFKHTIWVVIVPIAALAGLPLTTGFLGLAPLYDLWLGDGRFLLVIITSMLYVPFIAGAILVWSKNKSDSKLETPLTSKRVRNIVGILLPTIGLLTFPNMDLSEINWISILSIITAAILGVILSQNIGLVEKIQTGLNNVGQINVPQEGIRQALDAISKSYKVITQGMAAIFEGELGMLWLLVVILILWLAGRG